MSELKHYGIEGQKWRIRRYRNYDGTLTEEGKLRYYGDSKAEDSNTSNLDNNQLQQRINRMNLERQYNELADITKTEMAEAVQRMNLQRQYESLMKDELNKGKVTVDKVLKGLKTTAAFLTTSIVIQRAFKTIIEAEKRKFMNAGNNNNS